MLAYSRSVLRAPMHSYSSGNLVPEYLWRIFHVEQMDLEYTYSQMVNLCRDPKEVYTSTKFRKQIKNQWARDDPAFVVIQVLFLTLASLAYSVAFGFDSMWHFVRIVLGSVFIEFLGVGLCICTLCWWLANKYMRVQRVLNVEQDVEWLYAFDVHCNGFFPAFLLLYVVQYFLLPVAMGEDFLSCLISNSLYAFAFAYYHYVSFLGYSVLPFLQNTQKFLYPIGLIVVLFVLSLLFRFNCTRFVLDYYFGHASVTMVEGDQKAE